MKYLGVTQATSSWLLGKAGLLDALASAAQGDIDVLSRDGGHEFVEGPVRLAASPEFASFWNVDYNTGRGDDAWGFLDLTADTGLRSQPRFSREVLERCLYVISQRLQRLLIDGAFIHRAWPNGAHTCLAGRGSETRQYSVGYFERDVAHGPAIIHSIVCTGPEHDLSMLATIAERRSADLQRLVEAARRLYDPARKTQPAPLTTLPLLRKALAGYLQPSDTGQMEFGNVSVSTQGTQLKDKDTFRTAFWTYQQWLAPDSPLSPAQRRILQSDALQRHPIRIVGPAGSGKTLLMMLLALRRRELGVTSGSRPSILYLVHNDKMADTVRHRLAILLGHDSFPGDAGISVLTLSAYGRAELNLAESQIVDPDALEAKDFQLEVLREALTSTLNAAPLQSDSKLFREARTNSALLPILTRMLMAEISSAIKGRGLEQDERRYVESDRPLSRLHGALSPEDRRLVFGVFQRYHATMFDGYGVLDSDDVAISLLGSLKTPIWELKRKSLGFDHVFVDEAQLYNENERRVLPLLAKSATPFVPIVLALDEAQDLYGQATAGLATLGIENVENENLSSIHRSKKSIIRLAFFVIQRSTDLFGPDFPDFTGIAASLPDDNHPLATTPRVEQAPESRSDYGKFVKRRIQALRRSDIRRIAVIVLAEQYWTPALEELKKGELPLHVLEARGERLSAKDPVVVLSRPAHIGGQEFDAVVLLGAERGVFPPRVPDNNALATAVEQQALRALYLSITRARFQVVVVVSTGASLSPVLSDAAAAALLLKG